jgi:hypothetical protein
LIAALSVTQSSKAVPSLFTANPFVRKLLPGADITIFNAPTVYTYKRYNHALVMNLPMVPLPYAASYALLHREMVNKSSIL